jgi:uridine kinase
MQGDRIIVEEYHFQAARLITERILSLISDHQGRYMITVAGEAGSGKSEVATALLKVLEDNGVRALILQQDDYFIYPPITNDATRREDIQWVGPQEVRLDLLDEHLELSQKGINSITKPLVHYQENCITEEIVDLHDQKVVIVEGTYTSLLQHVDLRVFIARDWQDTYAARVKRARDTLDAFNQEVMKIEHAIISKHQALADIVIQRDFQVEFVTF